MSTVSTGFPALYEKLQARSRISTGGFSHSKLAENRVAAPSGGSGRHGVIQGHVLKVNARRIIDHESYESHE
jgi:hypothetical protein